MEERGLVQSTQASDETRQTSSLTGRQGSCCRGIDLDAQITASYGARPNSSKQRSEVTRRSGNGIAKLKHRDYTGKEATATERRHPSLSQGRRTNAKPSILTHEMRSSHEFTIQKGNRDEAESDCTYRSRRRRVAVAGLPCRWRRRRQTQTASRPVQPWRDDRDTIRPERPVELQKKR
jgi:hypothetical protein